MVVVVMLMVGFVATAALMIGVAQIQLARTELRASTDAAAKAAAENLSRTLDRNSAIARGTEVAALNLVQGQPLRLVAGDFVFGRAVEDSATGVFQFNASGLPINSVRVTGRRTAGSASGPIPFFMGTLLGRGTFEPSQTVAATFIERDIVLVVDRSGSMLGRKFSDLRSALQIFTDTLNNTPVDESVALASYSTTATADVPLTRTLAAIDSAMNRMVVAGTTSISAGMAAGRTLISNGRSRDFVERTMIVMTDGNHNTGAEPRGVARQLANEGVVIHTITFGNDADQTRMREIAGIGRGRFFHAVNGSQLRDIYREIALTLSTKLTE